MPDGLLVHADRVCEFLAAQPGPHPMFFYARVNRVF